MIVEIACIVTDSNLDALDDGIQLVVHARRRRRSRGWTTSCARCTRSRGCSPQIERVRRRRRRRPRQACSTYVQAARAAAAASAPLCGNSIGTDRRFLDRVHARARRLPALPQHRRVVVQGAVPALVPGDLPQAARQGRAAPRPRRHPRVDRGAALLPRAAVHRRSARAAHPDLEPDATHAGHSERARGGRRGAWSPTARGAEWPIRPMRQPLPASVAEPAADLDAEAVAAARRAPWRRRRRRAATPT